MSSMQYNSTKARRSVLTTKSRRKMYGRQWTEAWTIAQHSFIDAELWRRALVVSCVAPREALFPTQDVQQTCRSQTIFGPKFPPMTQVLRRPHGKAPTVFAHREAFRRSRIYVPHPESWRAITSLRVLLAAWSPRPGKYRMRSRPWPMEHRHWRRPTPSVSAGRAGFDEEWALGVSHRPPRWFPMSNQLMSDVDSSRRVKRPGNRILTKIGCRRNYDPQHISSMRVAPQRLSTGLSW